MTTARAYFSLISYGDAIYAIGGWLGEDDCCELNSMERYSRNKGWKQMANLPYSTHRYNRQELLL